MCNANTIECAFLKYIVIVTAKSNIPHMKKNHQVNVFFLAKIVLCTVFIFVVKHAQCDRAHLNVQRTKSEPVTDSEGFL